MISDLARSDITVPSYVSHVIGVEPFLCRSGLTTDDDEGRAAVAALRPGVLGRTLRAAARRVVGRL